MKKFIIAMMLALPMAATAQNTWEMPEEEEMAEKTVKVNPDAKYLAGAVPTVDGKVVFSTTLKAPNKSANEIYSILKKYMLRMTKEKNQFETSSLSIQDSVNHMLAGVYQEWLVFKSSGLSLDRTRFKYTLIAQCEDGKADITISRISYLYEEERNPQKYTAEEWITDENALRKSKQKLLPMSGKFRRKTVDRKDYLFNKMQSLLK
ncbi:MAG: DUF4468 domain-containing protein [Prevotella sp.]|nr:DUF4468 domain-containing protein [Prevotella sp.]